LTTPSDDLVLHRWRILGWILAGLGIFLRLRQYFAGRPLWLDEAMVALNVLLRPYGGLLLPLDSDQTAPFPFLWAVKLGSAIGGTDERALRLAPILGGVALLFLMVPLARRILEPRAAVLAVGLTAVSPILIYYSNEIKPYGLDATMMALLALLTLRVLDHPDSPSGWGALCVAAVASSAAVSPVPFCLAGVAAALAWNRDVRRSRQFRRWFPAMLLGCTGPWRRMPSCSDSGSRSSSTPPYPDLAPRSRRHSAPDSGTSSWRRGGLGASARDCCS
jgi:uncharacterized membrane protein